MTPTDGLRYHGDMRNGVRSSIGVGLAVVVVIVAGCRGAGTEQKSPPISNDWLQGVQPLASPAADYSGQPQLSVFGDRMLLSWLERTGGARVALKFAERTDAGWSETREAAAGDDWFVNWADVPSVVRLADGSLAAHWLQVNGDSSEAYDVRLAFSKDDGRTWTTSTTPHHDGTKTEHGFASLFQSPGASGLGLIWLDGRATHPDEHESGSGEMGLRAAVFDRNGAQTSETLIDNRVCECCPTAAALTSDGPIVAFRDRSNGEIRDIYVSRLAGGTWTQPAAVHDDKWQITACPVNGPALSASGRTVAIAWFTAPGEQGHAFIAFSTDAGKTFGPPVQVDDVGAIGRVDVELLPDRSAVVSWIEFADQKSQFRFRRVESGGSRSASASIAGISPTRASGFPRVARRGNELVFAWTDAEASRVRTAAVRFTK